MDLLVEQKQTQNLANFFLMPFCKLRVSSFPGMVNAYLDLEEFNLVVEVPTIRTQYKDFEYYEYSVTKGTDSEFLFYSIPVHFHQDVARFVEGKYSEFSQLAKVHIRKYGRFVIKRNSKGEETERSVWLHVIEKSKELRLRLEYQLDVDLPRNVELASKPSKNNFL